MANETLLIHDQKFKLYANLPKPDFMLIGGAKCGTTSFSSYLPKHPQVKPTPFKEPNFWSWQLFSKADYQNLFVNSTPAYSPGDQQQICGDYSTSYLPNPMVPRRVRARLPDTKIIVLLRNPIDRAYSHYIMAKRGNIEPDHSFDEIVLKEIEEIPALLDAHQRGFLDTNSRTNAHRSHPSGQTISVVKHDKNWTAYPIASDEDLFTFYKTSYMFRSLYHDQLWRWMQLFPRNQILIIQAERFFASPQQVLGEISEFLNLIPYQFSPEDVAYTLGGGVSNPHKPGSYEDMSKATRTMLKEYFAPYNQKLFELIGEQYDWD